MIGPMIPRLVTTEEAVHLSAKFGTIDDADIAYEVYQTLILRRGNADLFDQMCSLGAVYQAGRIQGIREERRKRKEKANRGQHIQP